MSLLRALCVLLLFLLAGITAKAADEAWIREADALLQPDGQPVQQRTVPLQFRWDESFPGLGGHARYTLKLTVSDPAQPQALYFEHLGNQAVLSLNGATLREFGRFDDPATDAAKLSQLVLLPSGLLHAGPQANEIVIETSEQALRGGGLSAVRFGPAAVLEAAFAQRRLLEQTAVTAYAACYLLMGGLAAGLWWRQRDPMYGCFSLAALFGSVRPINQALPVVALPWLFWGAVLAIAYALHIGLIARFIVLALGRGRMRRLMGSLHVALGLSVLLAALSFALRRHGLWTGALALLLAVGLAVFGIALHDAVVARSRIARLIFGAGFLTMVAGIHDLLTVRVGWLGGSSLTLMPHAMFFFVGILAALVAARYNQTLADYRALNANLAERVDEREAHLREAFEALRLQQQEQAVLNERQRMMREIHDGIGSQLVGLLNMVSHKSPDPVVLEEQVRLALDEMRMAVDSLQPIHSDLTIVLATLRYRLQPRLQAAGIEVVWDVDALPPMQGLAPQAVLQIQRILLEGFTNVLKHARATRVTVQARWHGESAEPFVALKLGDNGIGLGAANPPGQGLGNMRARAAAIGALVSIEAGASGGTEVRIDWPVKLDAAA